MTDIKKVDYKDLLLTAIKTGSIGNIEITKEIAEDNELIANILLLKKDLVLQVNNLKIVKQYNKSFFDKILLNEHNNKKIIEHILVNFEDICQDKDYVEKLLDINTSYISFFKLFQNKDFLIARLNQKKDIGMNHLPQFKNDADIINAIIENDIENDLRWVDRSIFDKEELVLKMLTKYKISKELCSNLYYSENQIPQSSEFYKKAIKTNPYNITNIFLDYLSEEINWSEVLYESIILENKTMDNGELNRDFIEYVLRLPPSTWKNANNISLWLDLISNNSRRQGVFSYEKMLLINLSKENKLFSSFYKKEFISNLLTDIDKYKDNYADFDLATKISLQLKNLSTEWKKFKLEQELDSSKSVVKKVKI